jgi:hypothetical protein
LLTLPTLTASAKRMERTKPIAGLLPEKYSQNRVIVENPLYA